MERRAAAGDSASMTTHRITLCSSLTSAGDTAPDWVHLVPAGTFRGLDGRGPYRLADAEGVIRASMAAGKLPLDENHATDKAAPRGEPSPARGWIVEMQSRPDGLWGRIDWTRTGAALMADKAYRDLSPVLAIRAADGVVAAVLRASLTNAPNLTLTSLHSRETDEMDIAALRTALGLGADASEADVLAHIAAHRTAVETHAANIAAIARAAGAADGAAADAIVTHLQARGAGDVDTLRQTVVALQSQLSAVQQAAARDAAVRAVDAGIAAGKVGLVPLRDHYISRHVADPAAVEREIAAMPSINAGGRAVPPAGAAAGALDETERRVAELMGISPEAYAASRKALGIDTESL